MLICMQTTSVRINGETHEELKRLADQLGTTVGRAVTLAVRALRQDRVGKQLAQPFAPTRRPGSMLNSGNIVDLDLGPPRPRSWLSSPGGSCILLSASSALNRPSCMSCRSPQP